MFSVSISPLSDRDDLQAEWRGLEARADCPFFLSWGWMKPWTEELAGPVFVVRAHREGKLAGLALVSIRTEKRLKLFRARVAYLNQTGIPDKDVVTLEYNGFLLDKSCAREAEQACLQALIGSRDPAWDELYVHNATSEFVVELQRLNLIRQDVAISPSAEVDLAQIRASGGYISTLGRSTRYQIRRSMRLYEERYGGLRMARAEDAGQALEWFDQAGELHERRWAGRGKPGILSFPEYLKMHKSLIKSAHGDGPENGCAELLRVQAGDETIGYLYNFLYRGRVYFYLSGLRYEDDPKLKPGLVSHALAIQRHADEGRDVYDFMAGENRYKNNMGRETPALVSLSLRKPRLIVSLEVGLRRIMARFGS